MAGANGRPFVVAIAEQRRTPGRVRPVTVVGALPGIAVSDAEVPEGAEVQADLALEILVDGHLTATGTVRAPWTGRCRRCLQDVGGDLDLEVREVFEPDPAEDAETYPLGADRVDLEPMLRDALVLALPLAPLCRDDCEGPDPAQHPVTVAPEDDEGATGTDPRWAALGELRFDG